MKSNSIKRVKIADQISNVRSVAVDPPVRWDKKKCIEYVSDAKLIVINCRGVSEYLEDEFIKAYKAAMEVYK